MEEMYAASRMHMCEEKKTLLGKDDKTSIMYYASCIMHHASCIMHHESCIMYHASCIMHHASKKNSTPFKRNNVKKVNT